MKDPINAFETLQAGIKRYITSAFGTNSESFEKERKALLDKPGVLFQTPYVEPIPSYKSGKKLDQLTAEDLPSLNQEGVEAFQNIVGAGLFNGGYPLYTHQQNMLKKSLSGKHCVVVTGTGSGKTESFLLPVIANIIREATTPDSHWGEPAGTSEEWTEENPPEWNTSRKALRGENREAAVRTLILYPMNALVEDQVSRLRVALDSDESLQAFDNYLGKNRIRFGRFNGSTPVAGHPVKADEKGSANTPKRTELTKSLKQAIKEYCSIQQELKIRKEELDIVSSTGDKELIKHVEEEHSRVREQVSFIQRMTPDAAEMFHRWEMQVTPPDILVTNISMLSIMLMRNKAPDLNNDRADADIFEKTKAWLAKDRENNIFQLVIDELHLHRSSAGTEVAFLLRLLLDRLGLSPNSKQLQILASSASLDGEQAYEYLGQFFGFSTEDAKKNFHIEAGDPKYPLANVDPKFDRRITDLCIKAGQGINPHEKDTPEIIELADVLKENSDVNHQRILAAFADGEKVRAKALGWIQKQWFPGVISSLQHDATVGLFRVMGTDHVKGIDLPRLRFHWMAKNIDGLWSTIEPKVGDIKRRTGELLPENKLTLDGNRVLEVLYCECCGTQLLCGNRIEATPQYHDFAEFSDSNESFQLTSLEAQIDGLPETTIESRTDAQLYQNVGVVWLRNEHDATRSTEELSWQHRTNEFYGKESGPRQGSGKNAKPALWVEGSIHPKTGLVSIGASSAGLPCYFFQAIGVDDDKENTYSAMPQRCPSCLIDYSERRGGKISPIRSFVTGLARMSHLFSKHLMAVLPEGHARKLVAFSDSREAAANLAVGVEEEQWKLLLRAFINYELINRADSGLMSSMQKILSFLEAGDSSEAKNIKNNFKFISGADSSEWKELNDFFKTAQSVLDDPDDADSDDIKKIQDVKNTPNGYVQLDNILKHRDSETEKLTPLWRDFLSVGFNPGGVEIENRKLPNDRDWTSIFTSSDGILNQEWNPTADDEHIKEIGSKLRKNSWRAIAGRLLYDLEEQGIGYLSLHPNQIKSYPTAFHKHVFQQVCASVVRILTEENNLDPTPFEKIKDGWKKNKPTSDERQGVAKKRVYQCH